MEIGRRRWFKVLAGLATLAAVQATPVQAAPVVAEPWTPRQDPDVIAKMLEAQRGLNRLNSQCVEQMSLVPCGEQPPPSIWPTTYGDVGYWRKRIENARADGVVDERELGYWNDRFAASAQARQYFLDEMERWMAARPRAPFFISSDGKGYVVE